MQNFHNFSGTILQKSAIKNAISRFFCTFYKYRDGTPSKKLWFALSTTTPKSLLESRSQKSLLESRSMVHAGYSPNNPARSDHFMLTGLICQTNLSRGLVQFNSMWWNLWKCTFENLCSTVRAAVGVVRLVTMLILFSDSGFNAMVTGAWLTVLSVTATGSLTSQTVLI